MAKAKAEITISYLIDILSVTRYYKLQSSTASAPAAPTTNPPSGWSPTEPAYTTGSTNTLYFVDLTIFTNDTFKYSAVSKSSSYEAAKEAYNKAVNAQNTADNAYNKVNSRGEQLIVNGNGMMGNNTNFSKWDFDGSTSNNSAGSFTKPKGTAYVIRISDEFFLINPIREYFFSVDAKSLNSTGIMYAFIAFYDADKKDIQSHHHMYVSGTLTTLARDLNPGDTVVYVNDLSEWQYKDYARRISVWNYTNSHGYTYPAETYTRNSIMVCRDTRFPDGTLDYVNNTITLQTAYSGSKIPAGTQISQGADGGTYKYLAMEGVKPPTYWTMYSGKTSGVDYSGTNAKGKFAPGVAYAKVGFLWNFNSADDQLWITNVNVTDVTAAEEAKKAAAEAAKTATNHMELTTDGLVVGDLTDETLGKNILIGADSVDIRVGEDVLASYKANTIDLGLDANATVINLCNGLASISNANELIDEEWYRLRIHSRDAIGLESSGEIRADTYYETSNGTSGSGIFYIQSATPWVDNAVCPWGHWSIEQRTSDDYISGGSIDIGPDEISIRKTTSAADSQVGAAISLYSDSTTTGGKTYDGRIYISAPYTQLSGDVNILGDVTIQNDYLIFCKNNSRIRGTSPQGVIKDVFQPQNQSGNTVIGHGNYTAKSGNTNVYGNEVYLGIAAANQSPVYRPYYHGVDTINNIGIATSGFVTDSAKSIRFTVPLSKPIIGSPTITVTSNTGLQLRQNGQYTHGSAAGTLVFPTSYNAVSTNGGNHVVIYAKMSDTTNAINNAAIGVWWSGHITFSYG